MLVQDISHDDRDDERQGDLAGASEVGGTVRHADEARSQRGSRRNPDGELIKATGTETVEKDYDFRVRVVHVFQPDSERRCDRIRFQINEQNGPAITFSDARERGAGTAGVTGIWGTLPAPPVVKPRPLSMAAFRAELSRFVGAERAEEVIQTIRSDFFRPRYDKCQTLCTPWRVRRSPSTPATMP